MRSSTGEVGGGSACPVSRNRCRRSLGVNLSAWARLSSTCAEGCTSRPCSSQTYHDVPIFANCATSSRRKPGVRLRSPGGKPTSAGANCARRLRKKSESARRRSLSFIASAFRIAMLFCVYIRAQFIFLQARQQSHSGGAPPLWLCWQKSELLSRRHISWWSQTYDQETLVLVSHIRHTQVEHPSSRHPE